MMKRSVTVTDTAWCQASYDWRFSCFIFAWTSCRAVVESPNPESCSPECTREYCQANPSAICSARWLHLQSSLTFLCRFFWQETLILVSAGLHLWRRRHAMAPASTPLAQAASCWGVLHALTAVHRPTAPACTALDGVCTITWERILPAAVTYRWE